jgi:hypothetical protein
MSNPTVGHAFHEKAERGPDAVSGDRGPYPHATFQGGRVSREGILEHPLVFHWIERCVNFLLPVMVPQS